MTPRRNPPAMRAAPPPMSAEPRPVNAGRTSGPHAPGRGEDRPRRGVDARLSETSLARGQDAVGEDGDEEILHVVGQDVVATGAHGPHSGGPHEVEPGPR